MVLNSGVALRVAEVSARACQYIACNPERLSSDRVLRLIFCFPLQQLRRIFCFPLPPPSSPSSVSPTATAYYANHSDYVVLHLYFCRRLFRIPITYVNGIESV